MNANVYEWRRRFFRKHGGVEAAIAELNRDGDETGRLIFPDGARCEGSRDGACEEPPQDEVKQLNRVVRYREEMVRRAEHAFADLKQKIAALHGDGEYYGVIQYQTNGFDLNDQQEAMQALKKAQAKVTVTRRDLAEARRRLKKITTPSGKQRRLQRALDQQIEKQDESFREELRRTRI